MSTSELDSRNIALSMRKSVENLVISSQDAIGQSISQALTFSGVITQHSNQVLQENRSVSRSPSPSPSLRNHSDNISTNDIVDNDKDFPWSLVGSALLQPPGAPALRDPDAVSLSDLAALPGRQDGKMTPNAKGSDGGARSKKKSWYSSLYPTYKSRHEDFKRLFKDLPDDERLIVDYSCALQKDILAHGRLYVSQKYLCFYANIFGWETNLKLRWKDVTAITKEKTALVIPNAILVCTEGEKHFLTSFSGRDKAYLMLFRVWQNALMEQPMSSHEIWQWVHSCYGEELGFNSDEEGYARDGDDDKLTPLPSLAGEELADTSSLETGSTQDRDELRSSRQARDSSPPLETNGDGGCDEDPADALPTDMSDSSESDRDKHHAAAGEVLACTSPHAGRLLLRMTVSVNIDQLFTMIFTSSKFSLELLAARGTSDFVQATWQPLSGLECRQISYTLALTSGPIGPKEVQVTETQTINKCSKPGQLYSIDSSGKNAGIPYADYFQVDTHYCLQRTAESETLLLFYGQVKYQKTVWSMIKNFIEKNTMSGLEDFAKLLEAQLLAEVEGGAPAKRRGRRRRRATSSSQETAASVAHKSPSLPPLHARARLAPPAPSLGWLYGCVLLLLLINALLYWTLQRREPQAFNMDELQVRLSSQSGSQMADWSKLLEQHTHRQRGQLRAWRQALDRAVSHLTQTEQALSKLLETIKPSLEQAQKEASETHASHSEL